jgi:predicted enzyme related to lactoylglutathione lyase
LGIKFEGVTVDALDPRGLAEFWAAVLGWKVGGELEEIEVWIQPDTSDSVITGFPEILFLINTDAKRVKNRLHLDLRPDNQAEEVARLEKLGAKRIDIGQNQNERCTWIVMADPEGNEFCVLNDKKGSRD